MLRNFRKNRGDTIIEVLFAVTIFSLVAVGALSIMNQGMATAQRALEITLVRNEMDAQAEALRFINSSYIDKGKKIEQWLNIRNSMTSVNISGLSRTKCPDSDDIPTNSFIIDTKTATPRILDRNNYEQAPVFSQVYYNDNVFNRAQGIWIEAFRVVGGDLGDINQDNAGYIDFHIRACWDSPGQSTPVTLGTIVRLYEPQ